MNEWLNTLEVAKRRRWRLVARPSIFFHNTLPATDSNRMRRTIVHLILFNAKNVCVHIWSVIYFFCFVSFSLFSTEEWERAVPAIEKRVSQVLELIRANYLNRVRCASGWKPKTNVNIKIWIWIIIIKCTNTKWCRNWIGGRAVAHLWKSVVSMPVTIVGGLAISTCDRGDLLNFTIRIMLCFRIFKSWFEWWRAKSDPN